MLNFVIHLGGPNEHYSFVPENIISSVLCMSTEVDTAVLTTDLNCQQFLNLDCLFRRTSILEDCGYHKFILRLAGSMPALKTI